MRWMLLLMICGLAACSTPSASQLVTRQHTTDDFAFAVQQVIPVATQFCQMRRADGACDFQIVIDDRVGRAPNAFQSLGDDGQPILTFTTSLLAGVRNSDEIALIVAHEAAHHIDDHLGLLNQEVARIRSLGVASDGQVTAGHWADVTAKQRRFELSADTLGAKMIIAAGFDPAKAVQILARLPGAAAHEHGSHPAHDDRLAAVRSARP